MKERSFSERDIHLALDGELPADEREAFQRWLEANPDMQARSARFAADGDLLRTALASVVEEPLPAGLSELAARRALPAGRPGVYWRFAAVAAIFALGGALGYFARGDAPLDALPEVEIADRAIEAHVMYAAEKLHVVEVGADQRDHLQSWLSRRVGTDIVAPDLEPQGYSLVGGRLLPADGRKAAQFMYQDHAGDRISLYVVADPGNTETGFRLTEEAGARAYYWLDQGYCYAVAGAIPEAKLMTIANTVYRQLL